MWCERSGVGIRYEQSGSAGGRTVVLVHELGGSLESWDQVVPLLEPTLGVLRYDQRGAGLSEKVRAPFTIADHVRDLEAVLETATLTLPVDLVGVAAGAVVAVAFAGRRPELAKSLVLTSPSIGIDPERRQYFMERANLAARDGMRAIAEETLARSCPPALAPDRTVYDAYRARFLANDPVCYGLANRALADADLAPLIGTLTCPCLLLAGTRDTLRSPENVRALAKRFQRADVAVLDTGHFANVQAPALLADRILAFLRTTANDAPGGPV